MSSQYRHYCIAYSNNGCWDFSWRESIELVKTPNSLHNNYKTAP